MRKDSHWDATADRPWIGKMEAFGRKCMYGAISRLLKSDPVKDFDLRGVRKILLVKEPYRMGDLFQVTPTLRALKEWNPSLQIGIVVQDRNAAVFQDSPYVDFLYLYQKRLLNRKPWKIFAFFKELRGEKFDLAVTLETQRVHLTNDLISFFSGARHRLRYDGGAFGGRESNALYDLLSPFDPSLAHEVDRNFAVFRHYGVALKDRSLSLQISESRLQAAKNLLSSRGLPLAAFTAIHPGSYKLTNRWPLENYLEAAKALRGRGKAVVFILGPSEKNWKGDIEKEGFPVLADITILEMASVLKLSSQVICNDTGVMHVAGAVHAPTLALFGETNPDQWKPPGESVRFLRSPDRKISSITVGTVLNSLP